MDSKNTKQFIISCIICSVVFAGAILGWAILKPDNNLGTIPMPEDNYDTFLTAPAGSSDTTFYVKTLPTITESIFTIYASDGTTPREKIYCTGQASSPNRLTGCVRGLAMVITGGVIDETAGTGLTHSKNARIAITDNINFLGKALTILAGLQHTSSTAFIVGTGASSTMKFYFDNTGSTSTASFIQFNGGLLGWSDDGVNTYNFRDGGSGITASSTGGLKIVGSVMEINTDLLSNNVIGLGSYGHALKDVYTSGTIITNDLRINQNLYLGPGRVIKYPAYFDDDILAYGNTEDIGSYDYHFQEIFASSTAYIGNIVSYFPSVVAPSSTILGDIEIGGLIGHINGSNATTTVAGNLQVNGNLNISGSYEINGVAMRTNEYIDTAQDTGSNETNVFNFTAPAGATHAYIRKSCDGTTDGRSPKVIIAGISGLDTQGSNIPYGTSNHWWEATWNTTSTPVNVFGSYSYCDNSPTAGIIDIYWYK